MSACSKDSLKCQSGKSPEVGLLEHHRTLGPEGRILIQVHHTTVKCTPVGGTRDISFLCDYPVLVLHALYYRASLE